MAGKDYWYPFHFRWLTSRARMEMNLAEQGAYRTLIDYCHLDGSIPDDTTQLARMLLVTTRTMRKVWPAVSRHFQAGERGRLTNKVASEVIAEQSQRKSKREKAGRLGGQAKARNNPSNASGLLENNPSNVKKRKIKQTEPPKPPNLVGGKTDWNEYPEWFEGLVEAHKQAGGAIPSLQKAFQYAIDRTRNGGSDIVAAHKLWIPAWSAGRKVPDLHNWVSHWEPKQVPPRHKTEPKSKICWTDL